MTGNMALIPITEAERAPWYRIASHFGWHVEDGRYAGKDREQPNMDFNAPLRRLAAAWHHSPNEAGRGPQTSIRGRRAYAKGIA